MRFFRPTQIEWHRIEPAIYSIGAMGADLQLCKNWLSKQCHNIGKFVKKHKTEIIIGAVIVVAAAVVTAAIVSIAGAQAASSAAVAAGTYEK